MNVCTLGVDWPTVNSSAQAHHLQRSFPKHPIIIPLTPQFTKALIIYLMFVDGSLMINNLRYKDLDGQCST